MIGTRQWEDEIMSRAQHLLDEDFVDKLFSKFDKLIKKTFTDDLELSVVLGEVLRKEFDVGFKLFRIKKNAYNAVYTPSFIRVYVPEGEEGQYTEVFHILTSIFHELSHHRLVLSNEKILSKYIQTKRGKLDTIPDYVLQAIERPAFAISLSVELWNRNLFVDDLISSADSMKNLDDKEILKKFKEKFGAELEETDLGFVLYSLIKTRPKDRRRIKFLKLLDKTHMKIRGYLGKLGLISLKSLKERCLP